MKVIGKIFAVIFSCIFGIIIFSFSIVSFASSIYTEDFYSNIFKNIDLSTIKLSDLGVDVDGTVEDYLVDVLDKAGIDSEISRNIIRNDEIKEVLGEFVSECVEYATTKEEIPQIEKEDVNKILNNKDVKEIVKDKISEEDIDELINEVNKLIKENISDISIEGINIDNKGGVDKNAASAIRVK